MTALDKLSIVPSTSDESRECQGAKGPQPHVGLVYVVHGKLYWEGVPTDLGHGTTYFKSYPMKHSQYWKQDLVVRFPSLGAYDQSYFPRGAVVYDVRKDVFVLMMDECILEDPVMLKKIISEMGLPESKIVTSKDVNFQCEACRIKANAHAHISPEERSFEAMIKIENDGQKLFFPWGKRHTGYAIPSDKEYKRLRRKWIFLCTLISAAMLEFFGIFWGHYGQVIGFWGGLLLFLPLLGVLIWGSIRTVTYWLVRDLEKTDEEH